MIKNLTVILLFCFLLGCIKPPGKFMPYYQVETGKPYDEVLAELEVAISENNFRITGDSRVGKVIRERGTLNFPEYDTLQFCNLTDFDVAGRYPPYAVQCRTLSRPWQNRRPYPFIAER
jgi:hypothetical protein